MPGSSCLRRPGLRVWRAGEWRIVRCGGCGFHFQWPKPDPSELPTFYPPTYSAFSDDPATDWLFRLTFGLDARRVARLIGRKGRILDVGCGDGSALLAMRAIGQWELQGLEFDEGAAKVARRRGLDVQTGDLGTCGFPQASFDLIRMGHVIEHVLAPLETLRASFRLLKPGGVLFGETPNTACLDFTLFGRYWGALHLPRHITFFNHRLLAEALRQVGFVDIRLKSRLRTVGWSAGIQNLLSDRMGLRVPSTGRVRWYLLLVVLCLPLTMVQSLMGWSATVAFTARKPLAPSP